MNIVFAPDMRLKKESREVRADEFGDDLEAFTKDMLYKMYELNGVGLSAVQIGDLRRILVADSRQGHAPIVMINPVIMSESEEKRAEEEGCLSIVDFTLTVERSDSIAVRFQDAFGNSLEETYAGIDATIIQHEIDHLNGLTLLDRVSKLKRDIYNRKVKKFKRRILQRIEQNKSLYY